MEVDVALDVIIVHNLNGGEKQNGVGVSRNTCTGLAVLGGTLLVAVIFYAVWTVWLADQVS